MKLNLGCGYKKIDGYAGVDYDAACSPDIVWNLNEFPWPFDDNSADELMLTHVLEHLAPNPADYLKIWKEMYRICVADARIMIEVPYWRHDNFFHDPTHVRPITPLGVAMFDQTRNQNDLMNNGCETKLGLSTKTDFELAGVKYDTDATSGEPYNCHYLVRVVKPARVTGKK